MEHTYENRAGSARWADHVDVIRAKLHKPKGLHLGFFNKKPIYFDGDASIALIAGAGAGKTADILMYNALLYSGSMMTHDPKGEIASVSISHQHKLGIRVYCHNPFGLHPEILPQHRCNPLDILDPNSSTFHSDSLVIAQNFLPHTGSGDSRYFEDFAQRVFDVLAKGIACVHKRAPTLPEIYDVICLIESQPQKFKQIAKLMSETGHQDIRQTLFEMVNKQQSGARDFGGMMSTLYNGFTFMKDPLVRSSVSGSDYSLSDLSGNNPVKIFDILPQEFADLYAPLTRLRFAVAMLYKQRKPQARRILYQIDEAALLKNFPELIRCICAGRGVGNQAITVWQDIGQMRKNHGDEAVTTIMGSSQVRQFFGVRDLDTAQMVSKMLGEKTMTYGEPLHQRESYRRKHQALRALMDGADPFDFAFEARHFHDNAAHQHQQARLLMTPDEVMALPDDQQIIFMSGKNIPPILAHKYPYFKRRNLAGLYLNNPYHPPEDRVQVQGLLGTKYLTIEKGVPEAQYKDYPQFQRGTYRYVTGYK